MVVADRIATRFRAAMVTPPEHGVCERRSGRYTNYLVVGHNEYEFVLDFCLERVT